MAVNKAPTSCATVQSKTLLFDGLLTRIPKRSSSNWTLSRPSWLRDNTAISSSFKVWVWASFWKYSSPACDWLSRSRIFQATCCASVSLSLSINQRKGWGLWLFCSINTGWGRVPARIGSYWTSSPKSICRWNKASTTSTRSATERWLWINLYSRPCLVWISL